MIQSVCKSDGMFPRTVTKTKTQRHWLLCEMHEYTMLYPLEARSVLGHFVKVRMRPSDLFLDGPSDRDVCNRAPADGLLSSLPAHFQRSVYHSLTLLMMRLQTP